MYGRTWLNPDYNIKKVITILSGVTYIHSFMELKSETIILILKVSLTFSTRNVRTLVLNTTPYFRYQFEIITLMSKFGMFNIFVYDS